MLVRALKILWAAMAVVLAATVTRRGIDARTIVDLVFYLIGWSMLWLASARDRGAAQLRVFAHGVVARVAAVAVALLLLAVALVVSVPAMLEVLVALAAGAFTLWAARPRATALADDVGHLLLLGTTMAVFVAAGELVFRLPWVVTQYGAGVAGLHRWQQEHLDPLGMRSRNSAALSFRSLHTDHAKRAQTFRILALGDSFTWGTGIARTEDVWPYVLERNLQSSARPIEVINTGIQTYTTVNEAEVLATEGWAFDPDLVILEFTLNDPMPSGPHFARQTEEWFFAEAYRMRHLIPFMNDTLRQRSYFYAFLDEKFMAAQMGLHPAAYAPLYEDSFSGWRDCKAAIREMAEASRRRQVPMLLLLFPMFVDGTLDAASYPYIEVHRRVMAVAADAGIPALDLQPVFARADPHGPSWWALPGDPHPNAEGHRVAAAALTAKLRELNWAPSPTAATH
jgi:lysophospholipase L1-like esterase